VNTGRICRYFGIVALGCCCWLLLAPAARATTTTTTPFRGVTLHERTETSPRPLKINVVEIDLSDPDIHFRVTPSNGASPGETNLQTTRNYLTTQVPQGARMAINASFFGIVSGSFADNVGLTASDGDKYSPFGSGFEALNITSGNSAAIVRQASLDVTGFATDPPVSVYNAVSGIERIVNGGVNTASVLDLQPRTAAGVATGNRLVLITVDGRQPGVSEGVTTVELANYLLGYGVTDALNLDGGGSTTLAIADPLPRLLNVPVGVSNIPGTERLVGSNLALFAAPIPEPAAAAAAVFTVAGAAGLMRRRRAA
jgi:hypothetical protein